MSLLGYYTTCVDTFSQPSVMELALHPGSTATAAESRKGEKYADLSIRYLFEAVAVETSGVMGPSNLEFLNGIGRRMTACAGDCRETQWLIQRLGIAIARGNSATIIASGHTS